MHPFLEDEANRNRSRVGQWRSLDGFHWKWHRYTCSLCREYSRRSKNLLLAKLYGWMCHVGLSFQAFQTGASGSFSENCGQIYSRVNPPEVQAMFPNLGKLAAVGLLLLMSTVNCERGVFALSRTKTNLHNRLSLQVESNNHNCWGPPHPPNFHTKKHTSMMSGLDGGITEWMSLFKLFWFQASVCMAVICARVCLCVCQVLCSCTLLWILQLISWLACSQPLLSQSFNLQKFQGVQKSGLSQAINLMQPSLVWW